MDRIRLGIIGLGCRGYSLLPLICGFDGCEIAAVADIYEDRAENAVKCVFDITGKKPLGFTDHRYMLEKGVIDAAVIISPWQTHVPMCIEFMEAGIPVATEVGGASTLDECFDLVRTYEKTKTPFMFLENCCYGRLEMMVLNMVRQGLFGKIVHCEGGYRHDLRSEVAFGRENRHYRLEHYLNRNCENYPTHELGPIARVLDIGGENRMLELCSFATGSYGMNDYARVNKSVDPGLQSAPFAQGDVVTTVIKCLRGQTVVLTLDTTLPRPYSRGFTVQGTRGMYCEDGNYIYLDTDFTEQDHFDWSKNWNNANKYLEKYEHPVWEKFLKDGVRGGHGGMDGLVYGEFINCLLEGRKMPIDAYDAAAWMCITPLSEISLREKHSVAVPDFAAVSKK